MTPTQAHFFQLLLSAAHELGEWHGRSSEHHQDSFQDLGGYIAVRGALADLIGRFSLIVYLAEQAGYTAVPYAELSQLLGLSQALPIQYTPQPIERQLSLLQENT